MAQRRSSLGNISTVTNTDDVIAEKVDLLFEKRKAVRQAALSTLHSTLALRYCGDILDSRRETLADGLDRVLKDQQLEPTYAALRTAALSSITISSGHHAFYTKLYDILLRIIQNTSMPVAVRSEAVNTLATLCFMSAIFDKDAHELTVTKSALDMLADLMFAQRNTPPEIARAALQSYLFLASTLPSNTQYKEVTTKVFEQVGEFMNEEYDMALRVAAAKAMSILTEWKNEYLHEDDRNESEDEVGPMIDSMHAILEDKTKFKSADEKKKQRRAIKASIAYLEGGSVEAEELTVRANTLTLDTWTNIFRMDRFRACLGQGFMNHLEENKNLMELFDYHADVNVPIVPTMSKQERRQSFSEASKVFTKARSTLRAIRESEVGYATE